MQKCTQCNKLKQLSDFSKDNIRQTTRKQCKACQYRNLKKKQIKDCIKEGDTFDAYIKTGPYSKDFFGNERGGALAVSRVIAEKVLRYSIETGNRVFEHRLFLLVKVSSKNNESEQTEKNE